MIKWYGGPHVPDDMDLINLRLRRGAIAKRRQHGKAAVARSGRKSWATFTERLPGSSQAALSRCQRSRSRWALNSTAGRRRIRLGISFHEDAEAFRSENVAWRSRAYGCRAHILLVADLNYG
jgi:hypothetical protein